MQHSKTGALTAADAQEHVTPLYVDTFILRCQGCGDHQSLDHGSVNIDSKVFPNPLG